MRHRPGLIVCQQHRRRPAALDQPAHGDAHLLEGRRPWELIGRQCEEAVRLELRAQLLHPRRRELDRLARREELVVFHMQARAQLAPKGWAVLSGVPHWNGRCPCVSACRGPPRRRLAASTLRLPTCRLSSTVVPLFCT